MAIATESQLEFAQQTVDLFDEPAVLLDQNLCFLVVNNAFCLHADMDIKALTDSGGLPAVLPEEIKLILELGDAWTHKEDPSFFQWVEWLYPVRLRNNHNVFVKHRGVQLPGSDPAQLVLIEPRDDWGEQEDYAGDHSSVVFFETDLEGCILRGVKQLSLLTGFPEDRIQNLPLEEIFEPQQRAFLNNAWRGIRDGRRINGREMNLINAEGESSPFWIWLYQKHGVVPHVRGVAINISTQKSLAIALEAAEERFNVLYRESSDPVFLMTLKGEILSVNRAFEDFAGHSSAEMFMGDRGWDDFVHPDDLYAVKTCLARCVEKDHREIVEFRMQPENGDPVWFELGLTILHNEHGDARGIVAVSRDIDRRKHLEARLREQATTLEEKHRRAQGLIGNLKNFFTRINELPPDINDYINGVCGLLFETYKPDVVSAISSGDGSAGKQFYRVGNESITPNEGAPAPRESAMCAHVLATGLPMYINNLHEHEEYKNDPVVTSMGLKTYLGAPLRDSKGVIRGTLSMVDQRMRAFESLDVELVTIAALHIAARLRAEDHETARLELEDHLRRASKMEAVGMLAGGIAHDFNNILSGILGFSSYLLSKTEKGSDVHRDIGLIEQSATKASELTRQLLAFTHQKHFEKQSVGINQVIRDVLSIIGRTLTKDVVVDAQLDESDPSVLGDPGQLNQVIMNLALNGFDAMAATGGELAITTSHRVLTDEELKAVPEMTASHVVCLTMSDSGRGMDKETVDHIFDPFFTTKSERGGSGLGLSIVYGIVTNHEGQITVRSQEGEGTTFTVLLPASEKAHEVVSRPPTVDLHGEEVIMVVDDELILRQMVTEVLKGNGYKVLAFGSGQEAVDQYADLKGRIDLILLDMVMPGMNGYETFKAIREHDADVPILLTSGFSQVEQANELIESGAKGMLYKPYRSDELLQRIRTIIDE